MSARSRFALVIHFHQPVGNLDEVVARATERCYRPFLETLGDNPAVRATLHYSGCLLEWLEEHEPDVTERLATLVGRGQVELMTGGFYEPVLAALPHRDRVGQIRMLTDHLRDGYAADPSGLWLAERVWEQDVVGALTEAGVVYTVVDDTMFHAVGISDQELVGPFVTDDGERPLFVYAGDRNLRYVIPYKRVERALEHICSSPGRLFVYADDGEKFGEWPGTYEQVFGEGWLSNFFGALAAQEEAIETIHLGDHARTAEPAGRVYLGSSSYDEMMRWALPAEPRLRLGAIRRRLEAEDPEGALAFTSGAPWRAFLAKYPEVNRLTKRMVHVSAELERARQSGAPIEEARRELYRAQCNCAYWHGSFGGVYLGFMRSALWHHLMRAEALVQGPAERVIEVIDLDADRREEVLIRAPWGTAVVAPHLGGRLVELDDHKVGANLLASLARHREAYHLADENPPADAGDDEMAALQGSAGADPETLVFDEDEPGALIDMLEGTPVTGPYEVEIGDGLVRLRRDEGSVRIAKQITAGAGELIVAYAVTNAGEPRPIRFGTRATVLPLSLGRGVEPDLVEVTPLSVSLGQPSGEVGLEVAWSEPAEVDVEPIETASASLEGLEVMRQGSRLTITWERLFGNGARFEVELRWRTVPGEGGKSDLGVSASSPSEGHGLRGPIGPNRTGGPLLA